MHYSLYAYMHKDVCVCACVREREGESLSVANQTISSHTELRCFVNWD